MLDNETEPSGRVFRSINLPITPMKIINIKMFVNGSVLLLYQKTSMIILFEIE